MTKQTYTMTAEDAEAMAVEMADKIARRMKANTERTLSALHALVNEVQQVDDGCGQMTSAATAAFREGIRVINILEGKAKHTFVRVGYCPVCQHYGSDCTGDK